MTIFKNLLNSYAANSKLNLSYSLLFSERDLFTQPLTQVYCYSNIALYQTALFHQVKSMFEHCSFFTQAKKRNNIIPLPAMKWFAQIFSAYLMVLSCVPCNDGEHGHGQSVGNPVQISVLTDDQGCPQHRHCNDLCSPLCGCHCCTSIFIFQKMAVLTFKEPQPIGEKQVFPEGIFPVKDMAFAIDHPPQLS